MDITSPCKITTSLKDLHITIENNFAIDSILLFVNDSFCKVITKPFYLSLEPRGKDSHMEQTGMLIGNFEFNPLKETTWVWLKLFGTPETKETNLDVA